MFKQTPKIPKLITRASLVAILVIVAVTSFAINMSRGNEAVAATSSTINFQARLLTATGSVVPDGLYNVEFKLYDTASTGGTSQGSCSGNCVWMETRTSGNRVRVVNGYLTANLGSVTAFGGSINWDQELWLTMNVGGTGSPSFDGEMSPRLKLTAVPYALRAGKLVGGSGSNVTTLDAGTPSGNNTIHLPAESGTVCIQNSTNCGFATSSGSGNYIQNGTSMQAGANFYIQSAANNSVGGIIRGASGQTSSLFQLLDGSTGYTVAQFSNNGYLSLGSDNIVRGGQITLHDTTTGNGFSGTINTPAAFTASRTITLPDESGTICIQNSTNCGFATSSGSGNYIQNGTSVQTANFAIRSNAIGSVTGVIQGANGQTADIFRIQTWNGTTATSVVTVSNAGLLTASAGINVTSGVTATGTISLNASSNNNTSINTGTSTGTVTIGGGSAPIVIDSTNFDVSSAGALSGITTITTSGNINSQTISSAANFTGTVTIQGSNSLTLGTSTSNTGSIIFRGSGNSGTVTVAGPNSPNVGNYTVTIPAVSANATFCTDNSVCTGYAPASGSANYIQNGTTVQSGANFAIRSAAIGNVGALVQGANGQTADLLQVQTWNGTTGTTVFGIGNTGNITATGTYNSNTFNSSTLTFGAAGTATISSAASQALTVTSNAAATWSTTNGNLSIQAQGNLNLGNGGGQTINMGIDNKAHTITIGNQSSTGAQSITIGSNANTGSSISLESGSASTLNIGAAASAHTINIGNGAAAQTIAVGSTNGASSLALSSGTGDLSLTSTDLIIAKATNSFQVQDASNNNVLMVDTANAEVEIGKASTSDGKLLFYNATNGNTVTLQSGVTTTGYTLTLPTALGSAGDCLKDSGSGALQFTACGNLSGSLQGAYNASIGSTTPEIVVDSTRGGVDIQDVSTPGSSLGANPLFAVRGQATASTLGAKIFSVQGNGRVAIGNITPGYAFDVSGDINISSGNAYKINGTDICTASGCTPVSTSNSYIQNQNGSDQTANFRISGTGRAGTALQSPLFDTPTATALNIGTTNATSISLNQNVTVASGKTLTVNGTTLLQPSSNSTTALNIKNSTNANIFTVDNSNGRVGINLGGNNLPNSTLEVSGTLRLSGTTTESFVTPIAANVPTKINIPIFDPGNFGQIIAFGLPSTAQTTSRAISLFDARTVAHQPTIGVFNPAENDMIGFSWEGSNSNAYLKTLGANMVLRVNTTDVLTLLSGGNVGVGMSPSYKLDVNGDVNIASGSAYKINGTNICTSSGCTPISTSNSYIQNQNSTDQTTANFRISGTGRAATALQAPLFDTATGVALNIGTTNATAVNLNQNTTVAAGKTLTVTSAATSLTGATSGDALTVSNSTSTGNVATFKDNNTNVFVIGDGGTVTSTTTASTSSAFVVQNGSSQSLFSTDTFNNTVKLTTIGRNNTSTYEAIWLQGSKNGITTLIGGNDSTTAYVANDFSGSIRFNGSGVGWGDFAYFPNGGGNGNNGQFRFSTTGSALNTTPNAKLGVGDLYVSGNAGIGTNSPSYKVDVAGDVNISTGSAYKINGTNICTASGCTPAAGSANYIQNQSSVQQASSSFWISGSGRADGGLLSNNVTSNSGALILQAATNVISLGGSDTLTANGGFSVLSGTNSSLTVGASGTGSLNLRTNGSNRIVVTSAGNTTITSGSTGVALVVNNSTSTGNVLNLQNNGTNVLTVSNNGNVMIDGVADSSTAFQILDGSNATLLNFDTTNGSLKINGTGTNSGGGRLYFGDQTWVSIGEYDTGDTDALGLVGENGIFFGGGTNTDALSLIDNNLNFQGDFTVENPAETKAYRFRTSGGSLDVESGAAAMYFSTWTDAAMTTGQKQHIIMNTSGLMQFPSVTQAVGGTYRNLCINTSNDVVSYGGAASCASTSSLRYKHDVSNLSEKYGLEAIQAMRPVTYVYNNDTTNKVHLGLIAEELAQIVPELVYFDEQGRPDGIDYEFMVVNLIKSIQQQQDQIGGIKTKQNSQQAQINKLRVDLDGLRQGVWNGGLVTNDTRFTGLVTFNGKVVFKSDATFEGNVSFKKKVTYSEDAAGTVTIPKGETEIEVEFKDPYAEVPRIALSADQFVTLKVSDKKKEGFKISLRAPFDEDVVVDWVATQVEIAANTQTNQP